MVRLTEFLTIFLIAGLTAAPVAVAQSADTPTVEEITAAFKKQKTRGLVIVPAPDSGQAAAAENADSGTAVTASTQPEAVAAVTPVAQEAVKQYNPVAQQQQINLRISFDFDSAALRDDQKPKLISMCQSMKILSGTVFQIIGHTDSAGTPEYNEKLSLLRAQEVRRHLIDSCGIDASMLNAIGMGETVLFDQSDPRSDVNRRVEFQALG